MTQSSGFAVIEAIEAAEANGLEVEPKAGSLSGFSGNKLTGLLQRIPKVTGLDYLEIGTYQGSSLLHTALANPEVVCVGIDNFAFFDPKGVNKNIVLERAKELSITNFQLLEADFEEALSGFKGNIGTYFIDGPHDYRSQLVCLAYAPKFLAPHGVIIVDDANYPHVRQATADFLAFWPDYKLVFEAYTERHPINMTEQQLEAAKAGWWDGVHVIVHDPGNQIEGLSPPTPGNQPFIRDHEVHGARWAPIAAYALDAASALVRPWELPRALTKLIRERSRRSEEMRDRFRFCNTGSQLLPTRLARIKSSSDPG